MNPGIRMLVAAPRPGIGKSVGYANACSLSARALNGTPGTAPIGRPRPGGSRTPGNGGNGGNGGGKAGPGGSWGTEGSPGNAGIVPTTVSNKELAGSVSAVTRGVAVEPGSWLTTVPGRADTCVGLGMADNRPWATGPIASGNGDGSREDERGMVGAEGTAGTAGIVGRTLAACEGPASHSNHANAPKTARRTGRTKETRRHPRDPAKHATSPVRCLDIKVRPSGATVNS
jgi:hypothetical protein